MLCCVNYNTYHSQSPCIHHAGISAKFSEMEYSQVEGNTLLVLVSISTNIATDLNLRVVPHNLSDFAGGNRVLNTTASFFIMFPHHLPDSIVSANGELDY